MMIWSKQTERLPNNIGYDYIFYCLIKIKYSSTPFKNIYYKKKDNK